MYPDREEFIQLLVAGPLDSVVEVHQFSGTPFVFAGEPENYEVLRDHLSTELAVEPSQIVVVGGARIGFSLNPVRFGQRFSEVSDVDVVVVSAPLFDASWTRLLAWHYPLRNVLLGVAKKDANEHQWDVYWGFLRPHKLLCLPDLSTRWFDAFQSIARIPALSGRKYVGRLYRTWDHAKLYHLHTLRKLRELITAPE